MGKPDALGVLGFWGELGLSSARVLPPAFFSRNTLEVARELLGKVVVVRKGKGFTAGRIVETEAYTKDDPACHAFIGKTARNATLFGDPGRVYVYFIYGMYEMLNFVTEPDGEPGAVLIRAIEPVRGIAPRRKTDGPGKLARALGVKLADKGQPIAGPKYWVIDDRFEPRSISASPRVGISRAKERYWRYFVSGHPCVSRVPQNKKARAL